MQTLLRIMIVFITVIYISHKDYIKINLINQWFFDSVWSIFLYIICFNSWYIYYININTITTPSIQNKDVKKKKLIELNKNMRSTLLGVLLLWFILINIIFISNFNTSFIFYDTFSISNITINYFYLLILVLFFVLLSGLSLVNQNLSFSNEYIIFVVLIIVSGYSLISSTSFFLAIFLLELIALLIFGKMAISRVLFKSNKLEKKNNINNTGYSYGLFNSLFFQFWANFVSSIFLFLSLINIHYLFGTSNFFITNYLFLILNSNWYFISFFITILLLFFLNGFFIKLGIAPYQFFKIETYKGIPLYIIIVYSTLYLIIIFFFFMFIFLYQLTSLRIFLSFYLFFVIILSLFYLISLLFDTKNFKAFLSYSTLIIISNILIIITLL